MSRVQAPNDASPLPPFVLEHVPVEPSMAAAMSSYPPGVPARIRWDRDLIVVTHHEFFAEIDPIAGRGRFARKMLSRAPLEITLKVAMSSLLPLFGGVPLHAASLVFDGSAAIFFGPSGAGKSTIASLAEVPVLSDELVAVREEGAGFAVRATGFWGTLNGESAPLERFPIGAVFELRKEHGVRVDRLSAQRALRKLLGVAIIPPAPPLWSRALTILSRLADSVPGYELGWEKDRPPWIEIRHACGN